jgi:hypothetical protein
MDRRFLGVSPAVGSGTATSWGANLKRSRVSKGGNVREEILEKGDLIEGHRMRGSMTLPTG